MTLLDTRGVPAALFGAAAGRRARFEEWHAGIHRPLATGRRVGVVQLAPRAGATTITGQLSRLYATRRPDAVLAVDLAEETADPATRLAARLGCRPTPADETRAGARTSADATSGLPVGAAGQRVLAPTPSPDTVGVWTAEVSPITRFFDVTVADFGTRGPLDDLGPLSALCDVVCLVARADRASAELARSVGAGIAQLPESPDVVLALVDRAGSGEAAARVVAGHAPFPVVRLRADRAMTAVGAPRSLASRAALLQLAATVLSAGGAWA